MKVTDDELNAAMLSGDLDALQRLTEEGFEGDDEVDAEAGEQAENDEGTDGESDADKAINDDKASKESGAKEADDKTDKAKGDASTQANASGLEIQFDNNGNAIIPKEMLSVVTKDGKHTIPYGVLEDQRNKAATLTKALEDERKARETAEHALSKGGRQAELLKKQLEDAGIDPEQLPEDIELSDDLLKSLDDYGDLGKIIKKLVAKQGTAATARSDAAATQEASNAGQQDTNTGFKNFYQSNADFRRIVDGDGDEMDTLDHFYKKVSNSDEFKGKPFDVVAAEALRRTQLVYGGPGKETAKDDQSGTDAAKDDRAIAEAAAAKVAAAQQSHVPASPSEIGATDKAKVSAKDRATAASGMDLLNVMGELTPAEMEELMSQL
ncbi:MAG: hypothetical protein ACRCVX_02255 [Shewanella sp.]